MKEFITLITAPEFDVPTDIREQLDISTNIPSTVKPVLSFPQQQEDAFLYSKVGMDAFITSAVSLFSDSRTRILPANQIIQLAAIDGNAKANQAVANRLLVTSDMFRNYTADISRDLRAKGLVNIADAFENRYLPRLVEASDDLTDAIKQPITAASVLLIRSINDIQVDERHDAILHYLTLAKNESQFNPGAVSKTSSAKGQLQIINTTYSELLRFSRSAMLPIPGYAISKVQSFLTGLGPQWRSANRSKPQFDASQPIANAAIMVKILQTIKKEWTWDGQTWVHLIPHSKLAASIMAGYRHILRDKGMGRQLLVTLYHINGLNILRSRYGRLSHTNRLIDDPTYFAQLTRMPNIVAAATSFANALGDAKTTGDPITSLNSSIAKTEDITAPLLRRKVIVTSRYGRRNVKKGSKYHKGIDIRASVGTPIYAPTDGVIVGRFVYAGMGWGNMIVFRSAIDNATFRIAHCSKLIAATGARVDMGTIIAVSGKSGTQAPHIHLEYLPKGISQVDPLLDPYKRYLRII